MGASAGSVNLSFITPKAQRSTFALESRDVSRYARVWSRILLTHSAARNYYSATQSHRTANMPTVRAAEVRT